MWKDEALEGGERGREAIMMKESKKKCLFAFFLTSYLEKMGGNLITLKAPQQLKAFVRQIYWWFNLCL